MNPALPNERNIIRKSWVTPALPSSRNKRRQSVNIARHRR